MIMRTQLIRTATRRLDTLHAASYFSPVVSAEYDAIGLARPAQYFAARGCALGSASAELVAATFFSFNPSRIARVIPECWLSASPDEVHAARIRGVRAMLDALEASLDPNTASTLRDAAARTHAHLRAVVAGQTVSGRPLYAAHLAVLQEEARATDGGLFELWVSATLLREFRGDGHIAALVSQGFSGLEASVLDCATGRAWRPSAARRSRGWSEDDWRAVASDLVERGLLSDESDSGELTEAGAALKESFEVATDASVASAWSRIDDDSLTEVRHDAKLIAEIMRTAEIIPQKLFGRDPSPEQDRVP